MKIDPLHIVVLRILCFVALKVFYLQREIRTIRGISQKFIKSINAFQLLIEFKKHTFALSETAERRRNEFTQPDT
jgi:hypothetical protein